MLTSTPANTGVPRIDQLAFFLTALSSVSVPATETARLDAESQGWLDRLSLQSPNRQASIEALHGLLLKAARFELNRRVAGSPHLRGGDYDDLAHQSAHDALVAILAKLADFRGDSRFTTWAYKFALLESSGEGAPPSLASMRKRRQRHDETQADRARSPRRAAHRAAGTRADVRRMLRAARSLRRSTAQQRAARR